MKVCGFSFVRNGVKLGYPFVEAIRSILPLCDEVIVAVGNSTDYTLDMVRNIDPRVTVIETVWDDNLKEGGRVLAVETDKAFRAIPDKYDWCIYIQGDEVIHEKYFPVMREAMEKYVDNKKVEGFLFNYIHFFGSYAYVGINSAWYRHEIRIIRNDKNIFSYRDAQGFRKRPNEKLKVKLLDAYIYHYGWVRYPEELKEKEKVKITLYNPDERAAEGHANYMNQYTYEKATEPVALFDGTHPLVMLPRVANQNWSYHPDLSLRYASLKDRFKKFMGKWTGWYPGEYKNFKII